MNKLWLGQVTLVHGRAPNPAPRPALSGRLRLAGPGVQVLTDATFNQALSAPQAVVDFWSPSCPICVSYKPVFEDVASQAGGRILMASVDVDEAMQAAGGYHIQSIPATIFLVNGKEVHRVEGGMTKEDLLGEMSRAFGGGLPQPGSAPAPASFPTGTVVAVGGVAAAGLLAYFLLR